jgi:ribonuclease T2
LSTQFWDYHPATGSDDEFTLHGLWSDECSGGYNQYCNTAWEITNATQVLVDLGYESLLEEMEAVWKNQGAPDSDLWLHEFNKHGTCMATVNPACYDSDAAQYQYVGDFYTTAVDLYKQLPTYTFLTNAGIYPSETETWTVAQFQNAISGCFGYDVYLGCDSNNALDEVWYFFSLQGSVADGNFTPIASASSSTCNDGFYWYPKGYSPSGSDNTDATGSSQSGYFEVQGQTGCLISNGNWYTSGTCATFNVTTTIGGVQLTSSKGACGIVNGQFECGPSVTASDFTLDSDDYLNYGGSPVFNAESVPSGTNQAAVSTGSGAITFDLKFTAK